MNRRTVRVCATAVAAGLVASSHLSAAEIYWQGGIGNLTDANYTDGLATNLAPVAGDFLNIGEGGTANHSTSLASGRLRVGHNFTGGQATGGDVGAGTVNVTAGTLSFGGNANSGASGVGAGIVVGYNADGTLNISGGTVTSTRFVIVGADTTTDTVSGTGTGTLNLSGTGSLTSSLNNLNVGSGNNGAVTVRDAATLTVGAGAATDVDMIVGLNNTASFTQTGGVTDVVRNVLVGRNSTNGSSLSVSAGTFEAASLTVADGAATNTSLTVSGTADVNLTGNIFIGRGTTANTTFTMSGGTLDTGNLFLMGTAGGATNIVGNHSGGTITSVGNFVLSDTNGATTYNLSGTGAISAGNRLIVGRQVGTAVMNQTGGTATAAAGVAVGDAASADTALFGNGTYNISGGSLVGNNATGNALSIAPAGTGVFRVIGDDASIDVNGNMLVNAGGSSQGTLAYRLEVGDLLSVIDVSGVATFAAGANLVLDDSLTAPTQTTYDLLTAADIVDNGIAFTGPAGWTYQIVPVPGGSGEILQAVIPEPASLGLLAAATLLGTRRRQR